MQELVFLAVPNMISENESEKEARIKALETYL